MSWLSHMFHSKGSTERAAARRAAQTQGGPQQINLTSTQQTGNPTSIFGTNSTSGPGSVESQRAILRDTGASPTESGVSQELQAKLDAANTANEQAQSAVGTAQSELNAARTTLEGLGSEPQPDQFKDEKTGEVNNANYTAAKQKYEAAKAEVARKEQAFAQAQEKAVEAQAAFEAAQAEAQQAQNGNADTPDFNNEPADVLPQEEYEAERGRLTQTLEQNGDGTYNNIGTMQSLTGIEDFSKMTPDDMTRLGISDTDSARLQQGQFITGSKEEITQKLTNMARAAGKDPNDPAVKAQIDKYANSADANNKLYQLDHNQATNKYKHKDGTWDLEQTPQNADKNLKIHNRQLAKAKAKQPQDPAEIAAIEKEIKNDTAVILSEKLEAAGVSAQPQSDATPSTPTTGNPAPTTPTPTTPPEGTTPPPTSQTDAQNPATVPNGSGSGNGSASGMENEYKTNTLSAHNGEELMEAINGADIQTVTIDGKQVKVAVIDAGGWTSQAGSTMLTQAHTKGSHIEGAERFMTRAQFDQLQKKESSTLQTEYPEPPLDGSDVGKEP